MDDPPTENPNYITVADAAARAGITPDAVRKAIARGVLPSIELYGRVLVRRDEFEEWRAEVKVGRPPGAKRDGKREGDDTEPCAD